MNIALCDDNTVFMNKLEEDISSYGGKIFKYNTVDALIRENIAFDIAFIDIEMKNECGFDAAKHIYIKNKRCVIAFFTNFSKYTKQGYDFRAFRYILKNEPPALIEKQITDVFNEFNARNVILTGSYKKDSFSIYAKDIMYIESLGHTALIVTAKGKYYMLATLSFFEKKLAGLSFIRCHKGFIVNLEYVYSINDGKYFVLFGSGRTVVPIGKSYLENAKNAYAKKFMDGVVNDFC